MRIKHSAPQTETTIPTIPIEPDEHIMLEHQIVETQAKPQEYSKKDRKVAILLSFFFGYIGVPFYYIGKPLIGLLSTIPFIMYGLIQTPELIAILELTNVTATIYAKTLMGCCLFFNFILVLLFSSANIKDKHGLPLK